jgi:hypothetical protein
LATGLTAKNPFSTGPGLFGQHVATPTASRTTLRPPLYPCAQFRHDEILSHADPNFGE